VAFGLRCFFLLASVGILPLAGFWLLLARLTFVLRWLFGFLLVLKAKKEKQKSSPFTLHVALGTARLMTWKSAQREA